MSVHGHLLTLPGVSAHVRFWGRTGRAAVAHVLMCSAKWSWLKAWAMKIARHRGMKKAIVALARRFAVIMHRIWVDGTEFRWTREVAAA